MAINSITHASIIRQLVILLAFALLVVNGPVSAASVNPASELERFKMAWEAANKGDHASFNRIKDSLKGYLLFPYLQYEDYRDRRASVPVAEISAFLDSHQDWSFSPALRNAWLKTLAKKGRWADLVAQSEGVTDTVIRCQRARGKIILKQTSGVLSEAQNLWAVGKSQADECDPVFAWMIRNNGITSNLAWRRIQLAMELDNRDLAVYLKRFVPQDQRRWVSEWRDISRAGYSNLDLSLRWPDNENTRMISATSIKRLSHVDAELAAQKFQILDGHFNWEEPTRNILLREIALYSAVGLEDGTPAHMARVPFEYRDSQLLEWWARFVLSRQDWVGVTDVIGQLPEETRIDDRWQYWLAQASLRSGQKITGETMLQELAAKANYYGFLAADELGWTYNICALAPDIQAGEIERIDAIEGFRRALELRKAGLDSWAVSEWVMAASRLPPGDLKYAAALAERENWYDRVIFALGNSGDLQFYEWRFPLLWEDEVNRQAALYNLDPAWVYGTIRSESAMLETAQSPANALGLMQITPVTGKRVARKHGLAWSGSAQLRTVPGNITIGTAYMSDLLQDFSDNPVLVSGSYNAGPNAVKRWLDTRPLLEAAIWVETLPYFETRDYIPRVLAFTTIYDWRLGGTVRRISSRMPHIESGKISVDGYTKVVCQDQT